MAEFDDAQRGDSAQDHTFYTEKSDGKQKKRRKMSVFGLRGFGEGN